MRAVVCGVLATLASCVQVFGLERDAQQCGPGKPFPAGAEVPIGGSYSVEAARFTPDQNQAYLSLCPPNGDKTKCDLYSSPFLAGAFTAFTKLSGVSDATHYDAYPTITADGKYLVFGSTRTSVVRVWVATAANGSFDAPALAQLTAISGMSNSNEPYLLADGRTLYLSGKSPVSQNDDLFRTVGEPPQFGGAAELVPGLSSPAAELAPVVSSDELEIFFASDRGAIGMPFEIFTATRSSASEPFGASTRVDALSTDGIDWPLWLSPDGCDLYYINKATAATMYVTHR